MVVVVVCSDGAGSFRNQSAVDHGRGAALQRWHMVVMVLRSDGTWSLLCVVVIAHVSNFDKQRLRMAAAVARSDATLPLYVCDLHAHNWVQLQVVANHLVLLDWCRLRVIASKVHHL